MFNRNRIKKTASVALAAVVALASCRKEDAAPVVTPPPAALQLASFSDGADVTRFDYNADGSLKTVTLTNDPVSFDNNVTYTVKYRADKKMDELTGSNGARIKLSYTGGGQLSKAEAFDGAIKISQTDYAYNGALLRSSTISVAENNVLTPFFKGEFTFSSAGNITRTNAFAWNPLTGRLEASGHAAKQYDDKVNPFAALGDVALIFWQVAPKNNVTRADFFNAAGGVDEVVETTYTYNAQGYPVRASVKGTEPGQPPVTSTITFTYR